MRGRLRISSLLTYLFVVPFCAFILFPFFVMFGASLKAADDMFEEPQKFAWWPESPQWSNFTGLGKELPLLGRSFLNSGLVAGGATLLALAAALPAAYALGRLRFRGRKAVLQSVLVTQMFSPIVIIVGVYKLFSGTWLDDNLLGLVLVNAAFNLAFCIWMLTGYLATVPHEVEEAAQVDGCSWWQVLVHVLMPLAAPGIVTAAVFVFIASWNEFLFAFTLLRTPEHRPVVVTLFSLVGAYDVQWNFVMAGTLLAVVPVVILFWLVERHLVSGLTAGSVK